MGKHWGKKNRGIPPQEPVHAGNVPRAKTQHKHPLISLQHLQSAWNLGRCNKDEKAHFAERLCEICSITWKDINLADKHGQGCETVKWKIRATVPECVGNEAILAFRFSGKKTMLGFRVDEVFHVLWLDPKFELYDHG